MVYSTLRYVSHEQALGPKTYAGKSKAACGNYHQGKECLDIHLLNISGSYCSYLFICLYRVYICVYIFEQI